MQKEKYVYKSMLHYRRKFLLVIVLITALFGVYTSVKLPYLKTKWFGASPLDTKRFVSETDVIKIETKIELGRKDKKTPSSAVFHTNSYWQDDKYLFDIRAKSVNDTGKLFKTTITVGKDTEEVDLYRVFIAEVGGQKMAVLAKADSEPSLKMKGFLIEADKSTLAKISETLSEGDAIEISEYIIDTRGSEMDTANTDFVAFWIFVVIILFLVGKLVFYYIKPRSTPTYRQMSKYGDIFIIEREINEQVESGESYMENRKLVLKDYIIEKSTFKLIINKNHMSRN